MSEGGKSAPRAEGVVVKQAISAEEREAVFRLRYDVYVTEMGFARCQGADHERKIITDARDATGRILYATADGELVGTIRVDSARDGGFDQTFRDTYKTQRFEAVFGDRWGYVGRLMVTPGSRGGPALQALVTAHYNHALEMGIDVEFLHAAPGLVQLYERLGCRRYAPNFVDPDLGYRVPMVLLLGDQERFEMVRSPFAAMLAKQPERRAKRAEVGWFSSAFGSLATAEFLLEDDSFWDFLADRLSAGDLSRSPLLAGLTQQQSVDVIEASVLLKFRAGDIVIRRGDSGKEMFLLLSGAVEARGEDDRALARLEAGEVFGEISFIANARRTADVIGVEAGELLVLTQQRLRALMKDQPSVAAQVLLNLARMLCERGAWRKDASRSAGA